VTRASLVVAAVGLLLPERSAEAFASKCAPGGPDPFRIDLVPTAHANGARGVVSMRFAESPFGVTVTDDGRHLYHADIETSGLVAAGDALVVWAATPSLDQVKKLGALSEAGTLSGTIAFNKFLVFVTAESTPGVERWAGPILLRGISPSGRMHTIAGHGPFQGESCAKWGFAPGGGERSDAAGYVPAIPPRRGTDRRQPPPRQRARGRFRPRP
jgi:hypothetical protein